MKNYLTVNELILILKIHRGDVEFGNYLVGLKNLNKFGLLVSKDSRFELSAKGTEFIYRLKDFSTYLTVKEQ